MTHVLRRMRRPWILVTSLVAAAGLCLGCVVQAAGSDATPRLLFGMGDQIGGATTNALYREAPVNMVTSWYNGPSDLTWMSGYAKKSTMSDLYGDGNAQELVVWLANHPQYAVSDQFQRDLAKLVTIYKGNGPSYGPLYIVLFTELETYSSDPSYRAKIKRAYLRSVQTIHRTYKNARVALGFGGYTWSTTANRDLGYWTDAIRASDFTAVQAMHDCRSTSNGQNVVVPQIRRSVRQLGSYGKPVMISHFTIWGDPSCRANALRGSLDALFAPSSLAALRRDGLFAFDFMSNPALQQPGPAFAVAKTIVTGHAAPARTIPAAG